MALTEDQMDAVRQHAGYATSGNLPLSATNDIVYMTFGMIEMSLYTRLTTLTAGQEARLGAMLTICDSLAAAISTAGANLDTDQAAVWVHNKNEITDRQRLYQSECRRMCAFLGLPPGPSLGRGGIQIGRA